MNDKRAKVKLKINKTFGSNIEEIKVYKILVYYFGKLNFFSANLIKLNIKK